MGTIPITIGDFGQIFVDLTMPRLKINVLTGAVPINPATNPVTLERLQHHKIVLETFGISSLSSLGQLPLSGIVVPQAGLLRPGEDIFEIDFTMFQNARRVAPDGISLETIGGTARVLKSIPFPATELVSSNFFRAAMPTPVLSGNVNITDAYWVATSIDIADNTVIVFKQPNLHLPH